MLPPVVIKRQSHFYSFNARVLGIVSESESEQILPYLYLQLSLQLSDAICCCFVVLNELICLQVKTPIFINRQILTIVSISCLHTCLIE